MEEETKRIKEENEELKKQLEEMQTAMKPGKKNLNESIITIRVKLQNSKIKKSGKNSYAGFDYYELSDFLPKLNELMLEEGVNDIFTITTDEMGSSIASLQLIKNKERQEYRIPFKEYKTPLNNNGKPSMQDIQYLGALNTYYKRYLYLNAFGITDGEVIDSMDNANLKPQDEKEKMQSSASESTKAILITNFEKMILDTGTDRESIYKHYEVSDVTEMTVGQLKNAIDIMGRK